MLESFDTDLLHVLCLPYVPYLPYKEKFGCPNKLKNSLRSSSSSMMAWWWRYWMMETIQKPSQWQTAWSKAVSLPQHSSVWSFQPCWQMRSATARMGYTLGSGLMVDCSTSGAWKLSPRWRRLSSENFCLLTTVPSTPAQSRRCNRKWTAFQEPATTSVSP